MGNVSDLPPFNCDFISNVISTFDKKHICLLNIIQSHCVMSLFCPVGILEDLSRLYIYSAQSTHNDSVSVGHVLK